MTLIQGANGAGKSSLLEALHYLCYLRSFRTHSPRDLVNFDTNNFFIKARFTTDDGFLTFDHELQVGFEAKKRLVKLDGKPICSYKELLDHYRIVTLTEDDLGLIKEGPEIRRTFIDGALLLQDPYALEVMKKYKKILEQRNSLLAGGGCSTASYDLWTEQLWQLSHDLQIQRAALLDSFEAAINAILMDILPDEDVAVSLNYRPKNGDLDQTYEQFRQEYDLKAEELRYGRSLFGAHLDDFTINFRNKRSRAYASRGQQKLIILLLKIVQLQVLGIKNGPAVFLLDDFMTDFDEKRAHVLVSYLKSLPNQLIFTSPTTGGFLEGVFEDVGVQRIVLTP